MALPMIVDLRSEALKLLIHALRKKLLNSFYLSERDVRTFVDSKSIIEDVGSRMPTMVRTLFIQSRSMAFSMESMCGAEPRHPRPQNRDPLQHSSLPILSQSVTPPLNRMLKPFFDREARLPLNFVDQPFDVGHHKRRIVCAARNRPQLEKIFTPQCPPYRHNHLSQRHCRA